MTQVTTTVSSFDNINDPVEYQYHRFPNPIAVALICHPHPLYDGTMNNKVVTTLAKSLGDNRINHLKFNFRGVGNSQGRHDHGIGETHDAIALANWLQNNNPGLPLIICGFSFGGYIAIKASLQLKTSLIIAIAPAIERYTDCPNQVTAPLILVQGLRDDIISIQDVDAWFQQITQTKYKIEIDCGHFFHGKVIELREKLSNLIGKSAAIG
ncbi:MAG: alpha/beta hydrolase [Legionellales bacterium]|nr:alpha/beta hydrolase [Legionellales bacterium]|tara:strand:- start:235 stop:867 length:633 start_codon:yes stop_codon:yes gene_type:complete